MQYFLKRRFCERGAIGVRESNDAFQDYISLNFKGINYETIRKEDGIMADKTVNFREAGGCVPPNRPKTKSGLKWDFMRGVIGPKGPFFVTKWAKNGGL